MSLASRRASNSATASSYDGFKFRVYGKFSRSDPPPVGTPLRRGVPYGGASSSGFMFVDSFIEKLDKNNSFLFVYGMNPK